MGPILNGWMTEVSSNTFFGACSLRYTCLVPDGRMTSSRGHVSRSRSHFVQQSSQQSGLEVGILYCTSWGKGTLLYFRHFMFLTDVDTTLQLTLYKGVQEVSRRFWFDQIKSSLRYWYFGVLHTVFHKFYCNAAVQKCISFENCVQFSLRENKRGVNTLQLPTEASTRPCFAVKRVPEQFVFSLISKLFLSIICNSRDGWEKLKCKKISFFKYVLLFDHDQI